MLRETNGGEWEGKTGAQNRADDFENFVRWIDGEDHPAGTTGERRSEVAARAIKAINQALAGKDDQLLVVTTHGGTARCVLGNLLQLPISHWGVHGGLSNASWSIVQTNQRGWHLVEHNAGSIPEPVFGEESGAPAMHLTGRGKVRLRGYSAAGSAPAWHAGGQGFKSP